MDYFQSYSLSSDAGIVAAWDAEVATVEDIPSLRTLIAERGAEIFPEFAKRYAEIRALPRSARRALQRQLAASRDVAIPAGYESTGLLPKSQPASSPTRAAAPTRQ